MSKRVSFSPSALNEFMALQNDAYWFDYRQHHTFWQIMSGMSLLRYAGKLARNTMNKLISLILLLGLLNPISACGWNARSHMVIAAIAYNNLSTTAQKKFGKYAKMLLKHEIYFKNKRLSAEKAFIMISIIPDRNKTKTLQSFYQAYDAKIPMRLRVLRYQDTKKWHYINLAFPNRRCDKTHVPNVVWAIENATIAYHQTTSPATRAILTSQLIHYISDAQQPLHTFSYNSAYCKLDAGGHNFCLKYKKQRCKLNLHQLWDNGFGFLSKHRSIKQQAKIIQKKYPESFFGAQVNNLNPDNWLQQQYQYAKFVYSTPKNKMPNATYMNKGLHIAQQQLALAAYRLANYLNRL